MILFFLLLNRKVSKIYLWANAGQLQAYSISGKLCDTTIISLIFFALLLIFMLHSKFKYKV